ncbi:hypothetical protein ACOMHN_054767 [Nucella lapillus]
MPRYHKGCSLKSQCQGSDIPKRWLPYQGEECTKITSVMPNEIQKDKVRLLTLDIQNLPDFEKHYIYHCAFTAVSSSSSSSGSSGSSSSSIPTPAALTTIANRTSRGIQCYTPATHLLPPSRQVKGFRGSAMFSSSPRRSSAP